MILALDIGSSSVRAVIYDRDARMIGDLEAQEQYEIRTSIAGAAEIDPDALLDRVFRCIDTVLAKAGPLAGRIAAVAVDSLVSTFLALDAADRPLTPLITYADTRNGPDAAALRRDLSEPEVHERTGCLLRTSYWPARLAWLRRTHPAVWRNAARWLTIGEYLELRLFGRCRVSYSVAAWSGLLDRRSLEWDAALLTHLGLAPEQCSPLVDLDAALHGLREPFAARWPALRSIPWFPAVGDGAAANIGSGCLDHSRIALTIGTTGALRVVQSAVERLPHGLWCYRVDRAHALLGGATSEGGNVYAWLRQTLHLGSADEAEAALAAYPPDTHGLTVLPFLAGERSPDWAGNVQATIHGLTLATSPIAILRACQEAVAYRFALIQERICGRADCDHRLIASGSGLLQSPAWMQIFADVLGRPLVASAEREATSRGAALLALRALGVLPSLADATFIDGDVYLPNWEHHAIYQAAIARQRRLYHQLISDRSA